MIKKLFLLLVLSTPVFSQSKPLLIGISSDVAFSSSFDFSFHPAHAASVGVRAEFQAPTKLYFYSQLYFDYQFHEINALGVDFRYANILQTGGTFGLGGLVYSKSNLNFFINLAIMGIGLTYNPKFSSYGINSRTQLIFNIDYIYSKSISVRFSPYFGVSYQLLSFKGQVARPISILLGISIGMSISKR
ncbi:MAG: hypothetical protein ACRC9L_00825 [Brevinema sp.]